MTGEGSLFDVPPAAIGRFRVLHQIGAGALGPVFRGTDPANSEPVVIRLFKLGLTPEQSRTAVDGLVSLVERLPSHPALAPAVDAGLAGVDPYLVTAHIPGEPLDTALREYGPAAMADAVPRLELIASALDIAATEARLCHGSLLPGRVIVSGDETVVLDVGVATIFENAGFRLPPAAPYTAPEVVQGGSSSRLADQFALAAIAFEWLLGRRIAGPAALAVDVPDLEGVDGAALSAAFTTALEAEPADRFVSCTAFVEAIAKASTGTTITIVPPAPRRRRAPKAVQALPLLDETPLGAAEPTPAEPARFADVDAPLIDPADDMRPVEPDLLPAFAIDPPEPVEPAPTFDLPAPAVQSPMEPGRSTPEFEPEYARPAAERAPAFASVSEPSRSRFGGTALAILLVGGLLIGAAGAYFMGTREGSAPATADSTGSGVPDADTAAPYTDGAVPPATPPAETAPRAERTPPAAPAAPADPPARGEPRRAAPSARSTPAPTERAAPAAAAQEPAATSGRILLRTSPPGAQVSLDGEPRGITPTAFADLPFGAHTLRITHAGYDPHEEQIVLTADRAVRAMEVALTPAGTGGTTSAPQPAAPPRPSPAASQPETAPSSTQAALVFETRPAGATVYVDGTRVGVTPFTMTSVAPGRHAIRFEREGYQTWTTTIVVGSGERARVAASLVGAQERE